MERITVNRVYYADDDIALVCSDCTGTRYLGIRRMPHATCSECGAVDDGIYRVPEENLPALRDRLAKLARRAKRLRCAAPELVELGSELETWTEEHGALGTVEHERLYVLVRVEGEAPRVEGYDFLATIEHTAHGNIVRAIPDADVAADELRDFRHTARRCDHCGYVRRRKDTYIVRDADGGKLQVGRNCLADYLGGHDPQRLAKMAELLRDAADAAGEGEDDEPGYGGAGERSIDIERFLACVTASIRESGWMSRSKARVLGCEATANDASWLAVPPLTTNRAVAQEWKERQPTDADWEKARRALWIACEALGAKGDDLSDYEHNLVIAIRSGRVRSRTAGLAASLVPYAEREMGRRVKERQLREAARTSEHFGTLKARSEYVLTVTRELSFDGYYGPTFLYLFEDEDGNRAKWFSSRQIDELETGVTVRLKATVKAHDDYKGVAQTALTRCKVQEVIEQAA